MPAESIGDLFARSGLREAMADPDGSKFNAARAREVAELRDVNATLRRALRFLCFRAKYPAAGSSL